MSSFIQGALYPLKAFTLLLQPGVRRFVLLPLSINFITFTLFIMFGLSQFSALMDDFIPTLPDWLQWLEWLFLTVFFVALMLIGFFGSLLFANLIASPFNGMLSSAVERHLTGSEPDGGNWLDTLKAILPAMMHELRKLMYFVLFAIPLLLLFIIPGINLIAPLCWLIFGSWILAMEYIDIPMANRITVTKHSTPQFTQLRQLLAQKRGLTLGLGLTLMLLTLIPILNFFTMPLAVAAATQLYVENYND